jgi:hypothetical protein
METSSRHRAEFRFKDRHHGPGGPGGGNHQHQFQYNLNTPTGVVEVELRVDEADTTIQVPDEEEVAFELKTFQNTSYLSVPFAAKYSLGTGRLRFFVKAGAAINFLLENQFEISERSSLNAHFRFSQGAPASNSRQSLRSISLDYLASLGLEYHFAKSWSLNLEPTFMGNLTSDHNDKFIQSSTYMAGVSGGLSYHF